MTQKADKPTLVQFRPGPLLPTLEQRAQQHHIEENGSPNTRISEAARRDLTEHYELLSVLHAYGISAGNIRQDLDDYYTLMKVFLPTFEMHEAMLMVDAMNGVLIRAQQPTTLRANVADAIRVDHLDERWQVDGDALIARLDKITEENPFAAWAIASAIRNVWDSPTYHVDNMEERIRKEGLVKKDAPPLAHFLSTQEEET